MVAVTIDSGEFPLMRNIDIDHQPSRSRVYTAWSKAFKSQVPWALHAIADVIEDVLRFELWKDERLDSPVAFFKQIGLGDLDLEEPAKAIAAIRALPLTATRDDAVKATHEIRRERILALSASGDMTQQQIAAEVGVTRGRVSQVLAKPVMTRKANQPRSRVTYQISQYTKPETAARRIREVFGDEFADALRGEL